MHERIADADGRKRPNVLALIFSGACGSRRPNPSFHTTHQQNECIQGKQRLIPEKAQQTQVKRRLCRRRLTLSFSGFLRKRSSGFSLRKWRMVKASSGKRWILRPRLRRIIFIGKRGGDGTKEEEVELCKKRILMGEKCRPLNPSGVLHYDEEGIFLPEDVLF